jgi:hypothetical protein
MALEADDTDALTLAQRAMGVGGPEALMRAQIEMVRWGVASIPAWSSLAGLEERVKALYVALDKVFDDRASGVVIQRGFETWIDSLSLDWATREAFESLSRSIERVFQPDLWNLPPDGTDLPETACEIVRAAGLWEWDELLSEASEFGDHGGEHAAQEKVREKVEAEANRALCAILRRLVPGL